jgi:hypothetical protein
VVELGWFTYWNAMYVVMIAMVLHTLNSALMMYATFTESTSLLVVSMILRFELLVIFMILRVGATCRLYYPQGWSYLSSL